jgi:hypothetical protein
MNWTKGLTMSCRFRIQWHDISNAPEHLGGVEMIRSTLLSFHKHLYAVGAA